MADVDAASYGITSMESNVIEFQDSGLVPIRNQWHLAAIATAYMSSQKDDAAAFVGPGVDWFYSNND